MSARYFIDTNVFIYHLEALDAHKFAIAESIIREGVERESACISFQVVQECLNTTLRKAEITLDIDAARDYLDTVLHRFLRFRLASPSITAPSSFRHATASVFTIRSSLQRRCQLAVPNSIARIYSTVNGSKG